MRTKIIIAAKDLRNDGVHASSLTGHSPILGGLLKSKDSSETSITLWPREVVSSDKVIQEITKVRLSHFPHCKGKI